ncbi:MAG TPA: peptidoglycan recognition family protein [Pseudomonadales bacterium]|nr:peptidoglycan recognition family protein [Pseudomonadales bacterium]
MLKLGKDGMIADAKIKASRQIKIERGEMKTISGIIVHQTGAPTAKSTFASYSQSTANGAHFLIDKDGAIYQTASIYHQTWHIGKLKSRCLQEHKCSEIELNSLRKFDPAAEHKREMQKSVPDRYPSNQDSLGIELVGETTASGAYVKVTFAQNQSLKWLVKELGETLSLRTEEVFRHPTVSRKNPSEASTAIW